MRDPRYVILDDRGIIGVEGGHSRTFLQGLVSNDIRQVAHDRAIHAAFLTPQGKYLHDFFVVQWQDTLLLECEAARLADLKRRFGIYRLRSKVAIDDRTDAYLSLALIGENAAKALGLPPEVPGVTRPFEGGIVFVDPRLAAAGARAILPRQVGVQAVEAAGFAPTDRTAYDILRIRLGLPDGSRDIEVEKAILLECGFDELHGIDWDKGCYLGQEVTARTKHRGLVKKRLVPVAVDGPLPEPGTPVVSGNKEVGEIRSGVDGMAMALIRLDHLAPANGPDASLTAGDARITPRKPAWAAS